MSTNCCTVLQEVMSEICKAFQYRLRLIFSAILKGRRRTGYLPSPFRPVKYGLGICTFYSDQHHQTRNSRLGVPLSPHRLIRTIILGSFYDLSFQVR
jgi:hypothetical protein